MHLLAGAMASWEAGPPAWERYWDTFRTTLRSYRQPDGIFTALPTEESQQLHSNSDRGCGPAWITASYLIVMGIPRDNLPVLLPRKEKGKPVPIDVPVPVEAETTGEDTPKAPGGAETPGGEAPPGESVPGESVPSDGVSGESVPMGQDTRCDL